MGADIYAPTMLERAPRRFKYIIIHDTNCQWESHNIYKIDKQMFQSGPMRARFRNEKRYWEMPYHFICEKIGDNYQTVLGRPLQYSIWQAYPDIDREFSKYAIHVCMMGNFNMINHTAKMYQQLCYRVLCPMMRTYRIQKSRIFLHGELSKQHPDCPGFNFNKQIMFAYMARYLMGTNS